MAKQTLAPTATRSRSRTGAIVGVVALVALGAGGFALLNALNPGLFNLDRATGEGMQTIEVTFDENTFPSTDQSLQLADGELTLLTDSSPDGPSAVYTASRTGEPIQVNEVDFCDGDAQPVELLVYHNNEDVTNIRDEGGSIEIQVPFGEDVVPFSDYDQDILDARSFSVVVINADGSKVESPYAYRGRSTHPNNALLYQDLGASSGRFVVQPISHTILQGGNVQLHFSACGLSAVIPLDVSFDFLIEDLNNVQHAFDTHNPSRYLDTRFLTGALSSVTITDYPNDRAITGVEAEVVIPAEMINEDDQLYGEVEFCASHNAGGTWQCRTLGEEDRDARNRDRFLVDLSFRSDAENADNRLMIGLRLTQDDNLSRFGVAAPLMSSSSGIRSLFASAVNETTTLEPVEKQFVKAQTTAATAGAYADALEAQKVLLQAALPDESDSLNVITQNIDSAVQQLGIIEGVYGGYAEGYITETKLSATEITKDLPELELIQAEEPALIDSYNNLTTATDLVQGNAKELQLLASDNFVSDSELTTSLLKSLEVSTGITSISLTTTADSIQDLNGVSDQPNVKGVYIEDVLKDTSALFTSITSDTENVLKSLSVVTDAGEQNIFTGPTTSPSNELIQDAVSSLQEVQDASAELRSLFSPNGIRVVDAQDITFDAPLGDVGIGEDVGIVSVNDLNDQLSGSLGIIATTVSDPAFSGEVLTASEALQGLNAEVSGSTSNLAIADGNINFGNVEIGGNALQRNRLIGMIADTRQNSLQLLNNFEGFLFATLTDLNPTDTPARMVFYKNDFQPFEDELTLADWEWSLQGSAHTLNPATHLSGEEPLTGIMRIFGADDFVRDTAGPGVDLLRNDDAPVASMDWLDVTYTTSEGMTAALSPLRLVTLPTSRVGVESVTLTVRTQEPAEPIEEEVVVPDPDPLPIPPTCHERNLEFGQSPTGPPFVVCGDTCEERNAYRLEYADELAPQDRVAEVCDEEVPADPEVPEDTVDIIEDLEEEAQTCEQERSQRLEAGEDPNNIPLCTPVDIPEHVQNTEDDFLVSYTLEHRDYHRVIVGLEFGAPYVDACEENPSAIAFRWGEAGSTLSETATVHYDAKNRPDQRCYAVLRGLKGGLPEGTDEGNVKNGRGRYEFAVALDNNTSRRQEIRTLNRTMSVLYYHCLVYGELCAEVTNHGTLESVKSANLPRTSGVEWWTNPQAFNANVNPVHPSGIKFAMMTDRRFNEFSDRLFFAGQEGKAAGLEGLSDDTLKKVIAQAYIPVFDRLFDDCIRRADCSSDQGGVNFWFDQMRTIPEVHRIDQDGVIYAMFISEEGQGNYLALAGGGQDQCEALGSYSYLRGLRRAAESGGAQNIANQECGQHGSAQADLDAMIRALAQSDEKENNLQEIEQKFSSEADACSGRRAAVTEIYQSCFGRASDTEGVDYWACSQTDIPVLELNARFCAEGER